MGDIAQRCILVVLFWMFIVGNCEKFRLSGGDELREGWLEVLRPPFGWSAVCNEYWDINSANVVCRQMEFPSAEDVFERHQAEVKKESMSIQRIKSLCTGTERSISQCKYHNASSPLCLNQTQVGVRCAARDPENLVWRIKVDKLSGLLRTKGQGRRWRYVCNNNWQMKEAIVACKATSRLNVKNITLVDNPKPTQPALANVSCTGYEEHLIFCNFTESFCDKIVAVECAMDAPDIVTDIPMLQRSLKVKVVAPNNLTCPREEQCLSASGYLQENLNKPRRLLTFSVTVYNIGTADLHPPTPRHEWIWHDCHAHYHSVEELATYELIGDGGVGRGHKISFCLRDSMCVGGKKLVYECDKHGIGEQGISVGCGDYYGRDLDCQWIDITDMPDGKYLLKIRLNPSLSFSEKDYDNNETRCYLYLVGVYAYFDGSCGFHK